MHIHTIQLNIERIIGGTISMDATEFGAYMSLLIACYQGKNLLPNDDARLSRIARCSLKTWRRIKPVLEQKFTINCEGWTHAGVSQELLKYQDKATKNKSNSLKRWDSPIPVASILQSDRNATKEQRTKNKEQYSNIISDISLKQKRGSRIPDNWEFSKDLETWALGLGIGVHSILKEQEAFKDYWKAESGSKAVKLDWDSAFRTWIRNSIKWKSNSKTTNAKESKNMENLREVYEHGW